MVEMKSGPLGPFRKNIDELGNCLDRGQVGTGEIGNMIPNFRISDPRSVVAPWTPQQRSYDSLEMRVMAEMGRNKWSSAHLCSMLFEHKKMPTQVINRWKRRRGGAETSLKSCAPRGYQECPLRARSQGGR